jgi:hypothetical protein
MAVVGIQALSYKELIIYDLRFLKDKSPELKYY